MTIAVIIERIHSALAAGELKQVPDRAGFKPVSTMADLLQPWREMFPGVELVGDDDTRDIFAWGGLKKPRITPQVRRSPRPLPAPRPIAASPRTVSPGLFTSVQGVWDFYQARAIGDAKLLELPFDESGMQQFIQPLFNTVDNYYPLFVPLEMMLEECSLAELPGIHLMLPHYSYDDDSAGAVEAFLSGVDGVEGLMSHYHGQDKFMELPDKDDALIKEVGFNALVTTYAAYQGEKSCDLSKLIDVEASFFAPVMVRFPAQMANNWPIISGDSGYDCDVTITCREDIEFCLAYAEAYERMIGTMPDPYDLDNNDGGITESFIHELCEVWRKSNNKRAVKWTSPKDLRNTLSQRMKRGEL